MAFPATAVVGGFFDIDNAIKTAYPTKALEAMVNDDAPFRAALKKNIPSGSRVSEGIVKFGVYLNPPGNVAQITDGDQLVVPGDRSQDLLTIKPTMFTGGFQIGWMTRASVGSNKSGFNGGELRMRTEETLSDMGKFIEQAYIAGDGTSKRAEVESDGTNNFVAALPWGTRLLRVGNYITARTAAGGDSIDNSMDYQKITAIDPDTRTVTYNGTDRAISAGAHISVVAAASVTGLTSVGGTNLAEGISANGLRGLVDDGTYAQYLHGLDRTAAANLKLKAIVKGNGGVLRNLTEQILINACHEPRERYNKRVTDLWTNRGQVEKYIEFVSPDRRYVVSGSGTQGKTTGYDLPELLHVAPGVKIRFNISYDILPRELFLLNWDSFFLYVAQELDWWDNPMLKPTPVSGGWKASYQAHLCSIENMGCDFPGSNVVIRDLKDPICGD